MTEPKKRENGSETANTGLADDGVPFTLLLLIKLLNLCKFVHFNKSFFVLTHSVRRLVSVDDIVVFGYWILWKIMREKRGFFPFGVVCGWKMPNTPRVMVLIEGNVLWFSGYRYRKVLFVSISVRVIVLNCHWILEINSVLKLIQTLQCNIFHFTDELWFFNSEKCLLWESGWVDFRLWVNPVGKASKLRFFKRSSKRN